MFLSVLTAVAKVTLQQMHIKESKFFFKVTKNY